MGRTAREVGFFESKSEKKSSVTARDGLIFFIFFYFLEHPLGIVKIFLFKNIKFGRTARDGSHFLMPKIENFDVHLVMDWIFWWPRTARDRWIFSIFFTILDVHLVMVWVF